ncbi:hypothetical protein PUNSTDRAFT_88129 [Punctularia strigosozonata HHB-11173 SS5]|uniref:uncharacterized protein n=1 Tax=Punctularia strigosozonata (strain HHB-11173) TaxID=741275 RepID=UPI00044167D6|nr:uncharacterized protein PUNSTDRAFT_88129 [Punctularia strigosozonata HHB-11173 SS5]EIN07550.1 hypothetical protein PUNSTDRAFT_88129 [Punctularia strigosozonata HHB-11173 SS5]
MSAPTGPQLQAKPEPFLEHLHNPPAPSGDPTVPTPSEGITSSLPSIDVNGILESAVPEASAAKEETLIDTTKPPEHMHVDRAARDEARDGLPKEVEDIGWNEHPDSVPSPIVKGLSNDDLWVLLRRFNKIHHVRTVEGPLPGDLDLNYAEDEEFSPEKLRATFERLYMTIIVGFAAFAKHVARLQSWNERNRTIAWLVGYYVAWALNVLMPALFTLILVLIVFPPSRTFLFPPAPLAAVSATHGGLQKPPAGQLHSKDSLTGAPEAYKGEAVENEASDFVSGMASLAVGTAVGKGPEEEKQAEQEGDKSVVPDPTSIVMEAGHAKEVASGKKAKAENNATKEPVQNALWSQARPVMRAVNDACDAWEMFGNALSPTPPFSSIIRFKLGMIVAPLLLASLYVNEVLLYKGSTFIFGIVFFGQPLLMRGAVWLTEKVPNWQWYLQPKNTLLKGVPTNAQLALTLLRIGEANRTPLPPPPKQDPDQGLPSRLPSPVDADDIPLDVSQQDVDATQYDFADRDSDPDAGPNGSRFREELHSDEETLAGDHHDETRGKDKAPTKKRHRITKFFKGTAKAGVSTVLGTDAVKAKVGDQSAKRRLGVLPKPGERSEDGPTIFGARYNGKKGFAVISTRASTPCISFTSRDPAERDGKGKEVNPVWTVGLDDIRELRKVGGLGFKGRLIVGYALGMQIVDGLEIVDGAGRTFVMTAIDKRDELFNRLIAIGKQRWEAL